MKPRRLPSGPVWIFYLVPVAIVAVLVWASRAEIPSCRMIVGSLFIAFIALYIRLRAGDYARSLQGKELHPLYYGFASEAAVRRFSTVVIASAIMFSGVSYVVCWVFSAAQGKAGHP